MTYEYAIRYGEHLVRDASWRCVADVIATYHGSGYVAADGRVTGALVRRSCTTADAAWEEMYPDEAAEGRCKP